MGIPALEKVSEGEMMRSLEIESVQSNAPPTSVIDGESWVVAKRKNSRSGDLPVSNAATLMEEGRIYKREVQRNAPTSMIDEESWVVPEKKQSRSKVPPVRNGTTSTKKGRIHTKGGNNEVNSCSSVSAIVEDSTAKSLMSENHFDLESGYSVNSNRNASENNISKGSSGGSFSIGRSVSRDSNSTRSEDLDVPMGQDSNELANHTPKIYHTEGQSKSMAKTMKRILCSPILWIVIVLIGTGGVITALQVLKKGDKDETTPSIPPSLQPTLPPALTTLSPISEQPNSSAPNDVSSPPLSTTIPTSVPINGTVDIGNNIVDLIVAKAPDGGASLKDPTSPQFNALFWLQEPINEGYSEPRLLQRYALATLYYATNPNNISWTTSSLWLTDANECKWYSTSESADICTTNSTSTDKDSVSIVDNMYTVLDLRQNGLNGRIPDEISLLTNLRTIRLGNNALTGSIPSHLTTLMRLEYLDLSSNQLVHHTDERYDVDDDEKNVTIGNIFETRKTRSSSSSRSSNFLSQLRIMQSLVHLDLNSNSFRTTLPLDLWGEGSPLSSNLKVLNLGSNSFYGNLPTEIGFLSKLTGLSIFDNNLSGQLPDSISQLSLLELLYADSNDFRTSRQQPGVPLSICDALRPAPLKEFWADCEKTSCVCCTTCCSEDLGCLSTNQQQEIETFIAQDQENKEGFHEHQDPNLLT